MRFRLPTPQNLRPFPRQSKFGGRPGAGHKKGAGFTLIELMIVISILLILISIAIPQYQRSVRTAREAVLRQDLYDMRKLISEYTLDKQKAPQSLDDLVQAGYLKPVPKDPITGQPDWQTEQCDDSTISSPDEQDTGGICDVHSSSTQVSTDGTAYNSW
ncbi:MAG TPA: prepilin-type N-terminal cleavage/methylation domain-containing protein [Terriglobales bacterium]|jgi:general secretion pathway protein G|nr:prepilin-type N-terminal cleavage/methylation domain-containing protein [Terriglobales bacterium]